MKYSLSSVLLVASFLLSGCAGVTWQQVDAGAVTGLSLINQATSAAIASGAIPKGNVTNIVTDANTISAGLETILTGQPLTTKQASDVAGSFHSNSATTSYAAVAVPIVNALVSVVNAKLASGAPPAYAIAAGTQVLVNAPAAVNAAVVTSDKSP